MTNTKIIFLRHLKTKKDPNKNAANWYLSKEGQTEAENIANNPIMQGIDIIYVSSEIKTKLTIEPLNTIINKKIIIDNRLNEVKRGDKFLSDSEFLLEKEKQLLDWNYEAFDGEKGEDALKKFKNAIAEITEKNKGKNVLVVSHGTILNLYFADLLDEKDNIINRWKNTGFGGYGILENQKLVKDIIN